MCAAPRAIGKDDPLCIHCANSFAFFACVCRQQGTLPWKASVLRATEAVRCNRFRAGLRRPNLLPMPFSALQRSQQGCRVTLRLLPGFARQ